MLKIGWLATFLYPDCAGLGRQKHGCEKNLRQFFVLTSTPIKSGTTIKRTESIDKPHFENFPNCLYRHLTIVINTLLPSIGLSIRARGPIVSALYTVELMTVKNVSGKLFF